MGANKQNPPYSLALNIVIYTNVTESGIFSYFPVQINHCK